MELDRGLTLLIGGARSGKSGLAVRLGLGWTGTVTFAATAERLDGDMTARIERHRLDRPSSWSTVEAPRFGADRVGAIADESLLILDCLTVLVSNLLLAELPVADHVTALAAALAGRAGPTIVVSNEVGMGVHPQTGLGRRYRDELGVANRIVADRAATALLIVAGRALPLQAISW